MSTTTTLGHIDGFLDDVLHQAQWRAEKAAEYPEDERNQNAADHLEALHAWLLKGAPEDLLLALNMALGRLYADPDENISFQPGVTDRLGRLGFYSKVVSTPAQFEADIQELIDEIREHLEPEPDIEDRIRAAAESYAETIKELEGEYLEEKKQTFYEQAAEDAGDEAPDAEELADRWQEEEYPDERDAFAEMVREAESDAWRS